MNVEIKKLTPELKDDYLDFFDNVAFTDNKEWSLCYCVSYHWNDSLEKERNAYVAEKGIGFNRKYILDGTLQGYLAYVNGVVVGWCNVNDKENFDLFAPSERPDLWEDTEEDMKIKSIVCYTIAPSMRRKGIATQLLNTVCEDAKSEGYLCVEAYPKKGDENVCKNYHGPYPLYEKCGFTVHMELEKEIVVRKYL